MEANEEFKHGDDSFFFGDKLKLMKNLDMDVIDIPEIALIFFFLILGYINGSYEKIRHGYDRYP